MGPEAMDTQVDALAGRYCQGGTLSPRDQLLQASAALQAGGQTKKDPAFCSSAYDRVTKAAAVVTPNGPDDTMVSYAKDVDHEYQASQCFGRAGDCGSAWTMFAKSKFANLGSASFKGMIPHCKDFAVPATGPVVDVTATAARAAQAAASAQTASQKMYKKDKSCLGDMDQYDRLTTDAAQRSTSPTSGYSQTRVICLMLSGKCDEGEKLQRAALGQRHLSSNIVDLNVKSLRQEWCK
jgi:hypothetical protein